MRDQREKHPNRFPPSGGKSFGANAPKPFLHNLTYTQPVGLGNPAILHAPFPGPEGKSS